MVNIPYIHLHFRDSRRHLHQVKDLDPIYQRAANAVPVFSSRAMAGGRLHLLEMETVRN